MFTDVEDKIKRKNKILFSRQSFCLKNLREIISKQKHTAIVLWAFDCLQIPLDILNEKYPEEFAFQNAFDLSDKWARGEVKMPAAKRAILDCHAAAEKLGTPYDVALCHALAQGCSSVHVETHALGLVFYELTAIVIKNNYKNYESEVADKIKFYEDKLIFYQNNIDKIEKERAWAQFLVKPDKVNKEKLLIQKELQL